MLAGNFSSRPTISCEDPRELGDSGGDVAMKKAAPSRKRAQFHKHSSHNHKLKSSIRNESQVRRVVDLNCSNGHKNSNCCSVRKNIDFNNDRRRKRRRQKQGEEIGAKSSLLPIRLPPSGESLYFVAISTLIYALLLVVSCKLPEVEAIKLQPVGSEKFYWSGEQFLITCQNNNNIKNVKIRWLGPNGDEVSDDKSKRVHSMSAGPHGHRLVVINATAGVDDGQYKCLLGSADDRQPPEQVDFQLKIYKSTSFKSTPSHTVLTAKQEGILECYVEFDPQVSSASVSWWRDGIPIDAFNDTNYQVVDYDPSSQLSQLIISPVLKQHDGTTFTCQASAVTSHVSRISSHKITLETHYGPSFDRDSQTVWVDRQSAAATSSDTSGLSGTSRQPSGNAYGAGTAPGQRARMRLNKQSSASTYEQFSEFVNSSNSPVVNQTKIARVELKCTCQANPRPSLVWTTSSSRLILSKGQPEHILEDPTIREEHSGHEVTSTLLVGYNLDPEWSHKRDSYTCSATNKLGKASKTYTIEQGDLPPAFTISNQRHLDKPGSHFRFTLVAPNFDPEATSMVSQPSGRQTTTTGVPKSSEVNRLLQKIEPPIDSFRITVEHPGSAKRVSHTPTNSIHLALAAGSGEPIQMDGSNLDTLASRALVNHPQGHLQNLPQNFTVNLSGLPSGSQVLYLQSHNAVGWSPNVTILGEYYLVSGASRGLLPITMAPVCLLVIIMTQISLYFSQ